MKHKPNMTLPTRLHRIACGLLAAGSATLCSAADITYNFDADVQGWYASDAHGSVVWDASNGRGGGGCLKLIIDTTATPAEVEIDPRVDVAFDTTGYFSVEFDMKVDASSGTDSGGSYGNLQIVPRDASFSWDAMWYGAVGASFNEYQHVKRVFTSAYGLKAYLQLQLQGASAYSTNLVVYIDNVVIRDGTPPTQAALFDFAWPESVTTGVSSWGSGIVVSHDTTVATNGALKWVANYAGGGGWQESVVQLGSYDWDPSKFTWLEFDLYVDAPTGLPTYGGLNVFQISSSWGWTGIGWNNITEDNVGKWTHYQRAINTMSGSHGIILQASGGFAAPVTVSYYVDNIKVWKPSSPPLLSALKPDPGMGGMQVQMGSASQWERNALVTPLGLSAPWVGQTPVTYSMTITNFPDAAQHPSFEAHIYLVNGDTVLNNETVGSADWNASDIVILGVQNTTNGGVNFGLSWKTNSPASNPNQFPVSLNNLPSALGTWSVTFTNDYSGVITGPGGVSTNFALPPDAVASNFSPANMFVQFGAFEGRSDSLNDLQSARFSHVSISNVNGLVIEDNFPGPELTTQNDWRVTSSTAVQWIPSGLAWWLTWTTPDDGYAMEVAGNVTGPYSDAGITFTIASGANKSGAVPAANIPAGNAAFFRMRKPVP